MPVNLSIKEVPEPLAERLRARAQRNHRSLQRELMAIVEAAVTELPSDRASVRVAHAPAAPACAAAPTPTLARRPAGSADDLLDALDAVVAGSQWGAAPVLTREQAHDRRLQREVDFDARRAPPEAGAP